MTKQMKTQSDAAPGERLCFVIAPIGDPETDVRRRSDQILKHIISPAAAECGYKALRADHISEPGIITSQVIQHIVEDPLVIADLTGRNPNVFYELAVRHAIQKPLVQIIKKGETIPFDVAGTRTVHVDHQDLDSVEEAKREIVKQVKAVETDSKLVDTPISVALDLQVLRQSENPEQRSLADLVSAISDLRTSIAGVEKRLDDPRGLFPPEYIEHISRKFMRRFTPDYAVVHEITALLRRLADVTSDDGFSTERKEEIRSLSHHLLDMMQVMTHDMGMNYRPTKG
jgi:hypothetical protein